MDEFRDAIGRFFGGMDEPVPDWAVLAVLVLLAGALVFFAVQQERKEQTDPEDEPEEVDVPSPVAIRRQPAEVFETDCDLCGCGYRYTVDYVKDFTTVCPHCGTKNPHGPADTDIVSRRDG